MGDTYTVLTVISLVIIVVALAVAAFAVSRANKRFEASGELLPRAGFPGKGHIWIVINPTKPEDYLQFRRQIDRQVLELTGTKPHWIETTIEDPGVGQAVEALRHDPHLVIAAGGDGTVRAVAAGMAHSDVPMAVLPLGTGNLLARNIGVPLDITEALKVALGPGYQPLDIAWLTMHDVQEDYGLPPEGALLNYADAANVKPGMAEKGFGQPSINSYAYLVIAGVGFDGETMERTKPSLKDKFGWAAYVMTSLRSLKIERMRAHVAVEHVDGGGSGGIVKLPGVLEDAAVASRTLGHEEGINPAVERNTDLEVTDIRAKTILLANCGELPFATLAPEASLEDGALDVIAIDAKGGLLGWLVLGVKVLGHSLGLRSINAKNDFGTIQYRQARRAEIAITKPFPIQVDGDAIGSATKLVARVERRALQVRAPERQA